MNIDFYSDFFSMPMFTEDKKQHEFKDKYIRSNIANESIYKFISFTDDISLNESKLCLLENKKIWASNYNGFKDKNELKIPYNPYKILRETGVSVEYVKWLINTTNQMNDISCFTYTISDSMWNDFANSRNGVCLQFSLKDSDKFFPIIYLNKQKIDFTNYFIAVLRKGNKSILDGELGYLAILPWVIKDEIFKTENELRFLCGDVYNDENGPMGGRIFAGKKEAIGYLGTTYSYDYAGICLNNIIIGERCSDEYRLRLQKIKESL